MAQYVYPAVFEPEEKGFSIFFPDLLGCYSQGENLADGMFMANDALTFMLYGMEEDGESIPAPTPLREIKTEGNAFATYILADTLAYRQRLSSQAAVYA